MSLEKKDLILNCKDDHVLLNPIGLPTNKKPLKYIVPWNKDLGKGICSTVKTAIIPSNQNHPNFTVALKSVKIEKENELKQLLQELQILPIFDCEQIVTLHTAFYTAEKGQSSILTLVLEYMEYGGLDRMKGIKMNVDCLQVIAWDVTRGLVEMHKNGILHRDLKPGNLLADINGFIKIADFGFAKELTQENSTASSSVGTEVYRSPEAIDGEYSLPSDIWSFGLTLLGLATGSLFIRGSAVVVRGLQNKGFYTKLDDESLGLTEVCRSFLRCCCQTNANMRWTAEELLAHPFIAVHDAIIKQNRTKLVDLLKSPKSKK